MARGAHHYRSLSGWLGAPYVARADGQFCAGTAAISLSSRSPSMLSQGSQGVTWQYEFPTLDGQGCGNSGFPTPSPVRPLQTQLSPSPLPETEPADLPGNAAPTPPAETLPALPKPDEPELKKAESTPPAALPKPDEHECKPAELTHAAETQPASPKPENAALLTPPAEALPAAPKQAEPAAPCLEPATKKPSPPLPPATAPKTDPNYWKPFSCT